MSVDPRPQADLLQETHRQIVRMNRLIQEIAQFAEQDVPPAAFFGELLARALAAVLAPAGAVWLRGPQGDLQPRCQINLEQAGVEQSDELRRRHDALLRAAWDHGQPQSVQPQRDARNPTEFVLLLVPVRVRDEVAALIEVFQHTSFHPDHHASFLQFLDRVAGLAASYLRNRQLRQTDGEREVWARVEAFARQIHGSLNPTEVAYLAANEGRRLVGCDRVSVTERRGRRAAVLAVSGADVVEKRSNVIRRLRTLSAEVLAWGERLVYRGISDETLPPRVLRALNAYLSESDSKLLVVLPLRDAREPEGRPSRSALVLESFEPPAAPEQLIDRLQTVGRHAAPALYNAVEHGRIPFRWLWRPLALLEHGLGGRARVVMLAVLAAVVAAVAALAAPPRILPLPGQVLKMEARGQLLPRERRWLFAPVDAEIVRFEVPEDRGVKADQALVLLYFDAPLQQKLTQLRAEIDGLDSTVAALDAEFASAATPPERLKISTDRTREVATRRLKELELLTLRKETRAEWLAQEARPGWYFWLRAPTAGTVLNAGFMENLTNRSVRPSDPLLRVGNTAGPWEVELRIPQQHVSQVLRALREEDERAGAEGRPPEPLDVDLLVLSAPTRTFRGKLSRDHVGGEARPGQDENEAEPYVLAWVRLDGDDIPPAQRLPRELFLAGTEVHARIRCGPRPLGYTLFHGAWEFLYERLVFPF